jgi:RimJ/RimL family protein N-acetyltransferase
VLRDDVIALRRPTAADADAIVAACTDTEVARFIPQIPVPYVRADAEVWIARCDKVWSSGEADPFAIADVQTDAYLGSIEFRPDASMIGYLVAPGARGRGIATRALRLVCEWRPERPLRLTTHPDNAASQRVAEKAGFRRVGMRPHIPAFRDGLAEAVLFELD